MPKLKNQEIETFDPANPAPVVRAIRALLTERISTEAGLKLRRITRLIDERIADVSAERKRLAEDHAEKDDEQKPRVVEGRYVMADPASFEEEYRALMAAEFEIAEFLTPRDLIRKVRDDSGKVYEVDDLPLEVILNLGELLQDEVPASAT